MRLGLLSASLGGWSADEVIARTAALGLDSIELAAWPEPPERAFTASHAHGPGSAANLRERLDEHGVAVAALAYYDNPLDPDVRKRADVQAHLLQVIELAAELGAPLVGTFVGRDPRRNVAENLTEAERTFPRLVEYAGERGVRLMIENCAMHGWHPDGYPGNLAYSPELWDWLETLGLWLNFDPSHLPPLGIDPAAALRGHVHRVVHVHAKDVAISAQARDRLSVHGLAVGRTDPWETGWWAYRLPGEGDIDWGDLLAILADADFRGTVAIEHEDESGSGMPEEVIAGVEQATDFLRPLVNGRSRATVSDRRVQ
jgi:sugar phosphate isomerase/epimerase